MTVKIKGTFAKDAREYNGLDDGGDVYKGLVKEPLNRVVVVGVVETSKITNNVERGGLEEVQVRFVSLEAMRGDAIVTARELHDQRYKERTGRDDQQRSLFEAGEGDGEAIGDMLHGKVPAAVEPPALPAAGDEVKRTSRKPRA